MNYSKFTASSALILMLAACGGGTPEEIIDDGGNPDPEPTVYQDLSAADGSTIVSSLGEDDAALSDLISNPNQVDFLTYSGMAQGQVFGLISPSDVTPNATYSGTLAEGNIQDGSKLYTIDSATVTATLSGGTLNATLEGFSGTEIAESYPNGISFADKDISVAWTGATVGGSCGDASVCGGTLSYSGADAENTGTNLSGSGSGAFFGETAQEFGGVIDAEVGNSLDIDLRFLTQGQSN